MHRKSRPQNAELAEISTQEYIRRVEEDDGEEFSRNPWILALDFLRRDGLVDATSLRDVKQCMSSERIDKVVAIVKSCKLNGLGDMMVTLKDPTDTVGASVHRKVLGTGDFRKLIAVGSVLILQKVVAFYSSCASCYLNITKSNVVKVISVDFAVQSFPEASAHSSSSTDDLLLSFSFGEDLGIPEKTPGLIHRRPEACLGDVQRGYTSKGKAVAEELTGKENSSQAISLISSKQIENAANIIPKEPIQMNSVNSGLKAHGFFSKFQNKSLRSTQQGPGITEGLARNHEDLDNAEKQRQVREFSSAPIIGENLDSRFSWKANGAKIGSQLRGSNYTTSMTQKIDVQLHTLAGTSSSREENLDDIDISRANDVRKEREYRGISSPSCMVENLTNEKIHKPKDPQKTRQSTETLSNVRMDLREDEETNGAKKQRLELISRTSLQEWTDEQLGILDMDDY